MSDVTNDERTSAFSDDNPPMTHSSTSIVPDFTENSIGEKLLESKEMVRDFIVTVIPFPFTSTSPDSVNKTTGFVDVEDVNVTDVTTASIVICEMDTLSRVE
ncbi:hypothetical protein BLNAU_23496 [Blattamonas nauphoetae]|uniref:Uncharacterized protein n=1 Tax=Blattamonas nauphoetae TaxID=2049346 RepID=A0ABQ9WQ42_9EUKA|nr:hypothetical protein BLNAU_23496 [Blattamonas nauphoetae]